MYCGHKCSSLKCGSTTVCISFSFWMTSQVGEPFVPRISVTSAYNYCSSLSQSITFTFSLERGFLWLLFGLSELPASILLVFWGPYLGFLEHLVSLPRWLQSDQQAGSTYRVNTLDKGMTHVPDGQLQGFTIFFRMPVIWNLWIVDFYNFPSCHGWLQVTETKERETTNKCSLLCEALAFWPMHGRCPGRIILTLLYQGCGKDVYGLWRFLTMPSKYVHLLNFPISSPTTLCHLNSEVLKISLFCALFRFTMFSRSVMLFRCNDVWCA